MSGDRKELVARMRRMHENGVPPSAILRAVEAEHPGQTVIDFMDLMRSAFGLSFEAVQCIGGWWHDGTGELTDHQLDEFLSLALAQAGHR